MIKYRYLIIILIASLLTGGSLAHAQWPSQRSVFADHEWYKIGVTEDGVYALDYTTLQSWGVDLAQVNPDRIRLFGNIQGPLPELNADERYDDLTEAAIWVMGAEDHSFDEGDRILFYGQGPVKMTLGSNYYNYERNPYTDTVFYFLCVDSDVNGLRIGEQASLATEDADPLVDRYYDYYYHESEELSPYASGRTWYGDLFTGQEGYREFQIELPGLLSDRAVWVESTVLGRCNPMAYYNLKLNDQTLVSRHPFETYKQREYGKEHHVVKFSNADSEHLTLRYELDEYDGNPMVFIDYFVISFWRDLRYRGTDFGFSVLRSQQVAERARVMVADADASVNCWEVTDPLHPVKQLTEAQPEGLSFGIGSAHQRSYRMFKMDEAKQVATARPIPNQNLHGLNSAELLIITPRVFWQQAETLADFHAENDAMNCLVVDVAEIYNEFSTGALDPTALRDFIRMLYLRSEGELKYVLLMGKGTHDYRCIKGVDNNFVPTYENAQAAYQEVVSVCSDDYYALMDENEGQNCAGYVDLGIGRIPITTPADGDAVIEKIKHYSNPDLNHGLWKNNHLFMADNDTKSYARYAEELATIIDTSRCSATVKKLYLDAFPVVTNSSGTRIPGANKELMQYFEKGMGVMSYTGHGGVKSLSAEWVLAIADILSLTNFDRLPFLHTATCEFSKFDNPTVVSGGELLLLNPKGGAVALFTTMRPTLAPNNQKMSKSVQSHLYEKMDLQSLRFGDIYRIVKSDPQYFHADNLVYVLFGDPALRFAIPAYQVVTDEVMGEEVLTVTGHIETPDGTFDTQFNGVLDLRLYDQKSKYTTMGNYDTPVTYSYHNDVLYEGKASVEQGQFEFQVPIPAMVNHGNGTARLVYSAYDSIRKVEAGGADESFSVLAPTTADDNQGPDIKLYWNTPEFMSGDQGAPSGTLYADLFDEHGIYHYNVSIGRDIVLNANVDGLESVILNDKYEPALDDCQRGRIVLPVNELADGTYEFTLRAWDTRNNVSEASVVLVVERSLLIAEVRNYPNPFTDEVYFTFVNGEMTEDLSVTVEVFDVMGRRVAMLHEQTASATGTVPPIYWNGRSDSGKELPQGVYLYKLSVTDAMGKTRSVAHPMVRQ